MGRPGDAQPAIVITLVSVDTSAVMPNARPRIDVPVVTVTAACARIVPPKMEFVPSVAALEICQNALHACPALPLITTTCDPEAVVSALPTWKTHRASGLFC